MGFRVCAIAFIAGVLLLSGCTGSGEPVPVVVDSIFFETTDVPTGGAGEFYNQVIVFGTTGGAAPPDRFELAGGKLPPGVSLVPDTGIDANGNPDRWGQPTGNARLLGYPRQQGMYAFAVKAISTGALGGVAQQGSGGDPNLAAQEDFALEIGEGMINIITPTAQAGTSDPLVPAFHDVISFVNPADPQAFFSFKFLVAGGTGNNINNVYLPRELELSVFDANIVNGLETLDFDTDETLGSGDKYKNDFSDGGIFVLQAGSDVQIGGFQSARGPVDTITRHADGPGLDPDWFQSTPAENGPALNSRRVITENVPGGDPSLGTPQPINFSDYFDPRYEGTWPGFTAPKDQPDLKRRKYPFTSAEYHNAFFLSFTEGVDITPLRINVIVEATDTRGTNDTRVDDVIARKNFHVQVLIPDIKIDTIFLPGGTAGVDYNEFVNGSGGVPPLKFYLEGVDGTLDWDVTVGDALTKQKLGIELFALDGKSAQFAGVPRASTVTAGALELTICISADVLNPMQSGAYISTNPGEGQGLHPVTGMAGTHKTYRVGYALPSLPVLANAALVAGVDGVGYPGDTLVGTGGVARLIPDPVGFVGTYPSNVRRTYAWDSAYKQDTSYPGADPDLDVAGLPNGLVLDGDPDSATNGDITGTPMDRGFHPVSFEQTDFYIGDSTNPVGTGQVEYASRALSISPDSAIYMRGIQSGEASGGEKTGLLDSTAAMGEGLMVPMFGQAGFLEGSTGAIAKLLANGGLPHKVDILPVLLANGGSDAHVDKSIPSVSGVWPAEAGKLDAWVYYYYGYTNRGWKHMQQEATWIQTPTPEHTRIYLFAETKIKRYSSATTGTESKRYQQYDTKGKRGILIENPVTGKVWIPAILDNEKSDNDGSQFGAEHVVSSAGYTPNYSSYGYIYSGYARYYNYMYYARGDREVSLQGMGSYLEAYENGSNGKQSQGRTATSVAVSADGLWAATAMPGGNTQKLLLWRTDKAPIPAAILAQPNITGVTGKDQDGSDLPNSACIVDLGGEFAGSTIIPNNQRYLLPDSLMFVRDGIIFLMETRLDYVFGMSLVDGHLSSRYLNSGRTSTGGGVGPSVTSNDGQYVPDTDYCRGMKQTDGYAVQFSFTGNQPEPGEEGPDKVAFVAGDNYHTYAFDLYGTPYARLTDQVRSGYSVAGNRRKSILFLETASGSGGLDLGVSTLKDLTGSDSRIYGDFLTPGRPGEELDFLAVSPDGNHVAAVRDYYAAGGYSYIYYGYMPTFGCYSTSSTSTYYATSDDLLIFSTTGADMDSSTSGTQTVLFFGSGNVSPSYTGTPSADSVTYASARAYFNSKARRINGIRFAPDNRTLLLKYAGHNLYWTKYFGSAYQYAINHNTRNTGTYGNLAAQVTLRIHFRTAAGGAISFKTDAANFMKNNLAGLKGPVGIGDTTAPFTQVSGGESKQQFWASFRSQNGKFQYFVCDQIDGRNYLVGFNITGADIPSTGGKVHKPFVPFIPHSSTIGFEQFDCNAWNYEGRFFSVPAGVVFPPSGRDGAGIVFIIGSDSSAGATSAIDLEVYAFDANVGGALVALTSGITTGSANAINHLYASADGNFLVGQRSSATSSNSSRAELNGDNDIFVVNNVHAALEGAPANAFFLSESLSHGSTYAFVGEGTATGPQALIFSAGTKGDNRTWATRQLWLGVLQAGAAPLMLDATRSHYTVLGGSRKLDDNPNTPD